VGDDAMNALNSIFIIVVAFIAVFVEATFGTFRRFLGVQVDLLPGLMVYASLTSGFPTVLTLALLGGLWFDSLSLNRLGVSVLPLLMIGITLANIRHLVLRDQPYAQLVLGFFASAFGPVATLIILFTFGGEPIIGWGFAWQLFVMTILGGLLVPLYFVLFGKVYRTLGYERVVETAFRSDREIARGRG
jgi:rod shape-determining protein MreD